MRSIPTLPSCILDVRCEHAVKAERRRWVAPPSCRLLDDTRRAIGAFHVSLTLLSLAAIVTPAIAADPPSGLSTVVISAATFPQPLAQALPSVSVLTRVQIERSGVKNLSTLLQRIAGVQITSNGGPGHTATPYLEGFGGTDAGVLVLLDGVPLTAEDASGGGDYLENLTTDQIERIEVIHGNVSAIYGSGAIGGVILITTRDGGRKSRAARFSVWSTMDLSSASSVFSRRRSSGVLARNSSSESRDS